MVGRLETPGRLARAVSRRETHLGRDREDAAGHDARGEQQRGVRQERREGASPRRPGGGRQRPGERRAEEGGRAERQAKGPQRRGQGRPVALSLGEGRARRERRADREAEHEGRRERAELAVEGPRLGLEGEEHDEPPAHPRGPDHRHRVGSGRRRPAPRRAIGGQQPGHDHERREEGQHHEQRRRDAARGGDETPPRPPGRLLPAREGVEERHRPVVAARLRPCRRVEERPLVRRHGFGGEQHRQHGRVEGVGRHAPLAPSRREHGGVERDRRRAPAADQERVGPRRRAHHGHGLLERAEERARERRRLAGDRDRGGAHPDHDRALGPKARAEPRQELDRGEPRAQERDRLPAEEEHEVERPADAAVRDEAARVVVHDPHARVAKRRPVGLREPLEQEGEGRRVRLQHDQPLDGVPEQHRHEAALDAPDEEDAPRPRHEQREEVAEARGAVRVGEAAHVLPARVEVEHVVAAEREVLVGRVGEGPQRQAGGRSREARSLGAGVEGRREGGDGQARRPPRRRGPAGGPGPRRATPTRASRAAATPRSAQTRRGDIHEPARTVTATPPRSEPSDSRT